jgi:hypothetical protein
MDMSKGNGDGSTARKKQDLTVEERLQTLHEAVRDVPDPEPAKVTPEIVEELREAGEEELAEVARVYA